MTFNEYNDLMGYDKPCTSKEYKEADAIYMMLDMDKQFFCEHYPQVKDNPIVTALADTAASREIVCNIKDELARKTAAVMLNVADHPSTAVESVEALEKAAIELVGREFCVKYKLTQDFALNEDDCAYLRDRLD